MVVAAAGQMSGSSQSLSQSATEQAASLEETSASVEQLALMTRKNADATNEVVGHLREVDARANESNQALSDMVSAMAGIQDSSRQVSKIIKTIDEIAFQTNILALNAAVEAARAGTAGMGFAVVADEVRSLAHRSAQAAQDTNELISQSISRAQSGTSSVERLTGSIASIMQSVSNVKRLADDVSVASRQQAAGIEQVSKAVIELEKSTQADRRHRGGRRRCERRAQRALGNRDRRRRSAGGPRRQLVEGRGGPDAGERRNPAHASDAPRYRNVGVYTSSFGSRHEGTGTFG